MIVTRRAVLSLAALPILSAAAPADAPPSGTLGFAILRHAERIGTHTLAFTPVDGGQDIHVAVRIAVGIGPLVLFHYRLDGIEQWRGGRFVRADFTGNDDGTQAYMQAWRDQFGLHVRGSRAQPYVAPEDAVLATHWTMAELHGPWINPQDGRLFRPTISRGGTSDIPTANGGTVAATQYSVSGDANMDLWYDDDRHWAGLLFKAHDGSRVRYERL
jgi:hypothetical protein